jgi:NAD(P)-dependent dehydrogenase (short-subunit alcohol dehydrogenase family)
MIAAGFCANGATVFIVSRKDTSPFCQELTNTYPGKAISLRADLAKEKDVIQLSKELQQQCPNGKLHCLVNNSGTNWAQPIDEYSLTGWNKVYDLNVRAVFHVTQQLLPLLRASGTKSNPARVINISSIDSVMQPTLNTFAYSSGKAAVSHLSRVLAAKLADQHITVNTILPGSFQSRMMRGTIAAVGEDNMGGNVPLGRIGNTLDMAGVAVMLAGRAGAWMTGASITLDGGSVIKSRL